MKYTLIVLCFKRFKILESAARWSLVANFTYGVFGRGKRQGTLYADKLLGVQFSNEGVN